MLLGSCEPATHETTPQSALATSGVGLPASPPGSATARTERAVRGPCATESTRTCVGLGCGALDFVIGIGEARTGPRAQRGGGHPPLPLRPERQRPIYTLTTSASQPKAYF